MTATPKMIPVYVALAQEIIRMHNLAKSNVPMWRQVRDDVMAFVKNEFPSGAGFDCGTKIALEECSGNELVFETSYHHHGEQGYTDWTEHTIMVRPSLAHGFDLRITGRLARRDGSDFRGYIHETFHHALSREIVPHSISPVVKVKADPHANGCPDSPGICECFRNR